MLLSVSGGIIIDVGARGHVKQLRDVVNLDQVMVEEIMNGEAVPVGRKEA
jgi:hypothetical protein